MLLPSWKQLPDEIYKRVRVQPSVYTVEERHVEIYAGKDNQTILKADRPQEFLKRFKGVVVTDGYSAYQKIDKENPDIVFAGCYAHCRRKFSDVLKDLKGLNYCINQEKNLKVFLDDPEVPMGNNETEVSLRSFCLHKHAWKVIDPIGEAKASTIIYSITETAKANG